MNFQLKNRQSTSLLILRAGLAFVFLYAAVASLRSPVEWTGYLPHFLTNTLDSHALLNVFAVYEVALALWLLSGKYTRWAALLCAATLAGIVLTSANQLYITFRDVGLACMALALALLENPL